MTDNETPPLVDQAVEAVARAIDPGVWQLIDNPNWFMPDNPEDVQMREASLERARRTLAALQPSPSPASNDHAGLIERLRSMVSSDGQALVFTERTTASMCADIKAAIRSLESLSGASAREVRLEAALRRYLAAKDKCEPYISGTRRTPVITDLYELKDAEAALRTALELG